MIYLDWKDLRRRAVPGGRRLGKGEIWGGPSVVRKRRWQGRTYQQTRRPIAINYSGASGGCS